MQEQETSEPRQFTTVDLAAYTASLIKSMDRLGTKIRRDEWEFGRPAYARVRINYAHREQRIHVMVPSGGSPLAWVRKHTVSVNLDSTDPKFPTLDEILTDATPVAPNGGHTA